MQNVYTVRQVNAYIKSMFTQDVVLRSIYMKGEVSNCKYHTSGHIYFSLKDESGKPILKKGKLQPDTDLRDTENVPLTEDIEEYFKREVLPFASDAWIDESKTKIGYEIPFTRYFYKYEAPRSSAEIMAEIMDLQAELEGSLEEIFE